MNTHQKRLSCENQELAAAWAWKTLEPAEEALITGHLDGCAVCQAVVAQAYEVGAALGSAVEQEEPPASLRESLLAKVAAEPRAQAPVDPVSTPVGPVVPTATNVHSLDAARVKRSGRGRTWLAAAAAAIVLAGGTGLGVGFVNADRDRDAQAAKVSQLSQILAVAGDPSAKRIALAAKDSDKQAVALVVTDHSAAVLSNALNANDTSKNIYVVWGIGGGQPVPLGTFDVNGSGSQPVSYSGSKESYRGYAVSIENGRTAPAAPSTVVAMGFA
ncbi:hypothetical protein D5S17_19900 [Pseudonocardiaceae bacterium YIM PH 21723]|nr:hypothetical protein D5S17_19900 [Pseudonocardiaceae bacterium YIM PH 21723]